MTCWSFSFVTISTTLCLCPNSFPTGLKLTTGFHKRRILSLPERKKINIYSQKDWIVTCTTNKLCNWKPSIHKSVIWVDYSHINMGISHSKSWIAAYISLLIHRHILKMHNWLAFKSLFILLKQWQGHWMGTTWTSPRGAEYFSRNTTGAHILLPSMM